MVGPISCSFQRSYKILEILNFLIKCQISMKMQKNEIHAIRRHKTKIFFVIMDSYLLFIGKRFKLFTFEGGSYRWGRKRLALLEVIPLSSLGIDRNMIFLLEHYIQTVLNLPTNLHLLSFYSVSFKMKIYSGASLIRKLNLFPIKLSG